MAENFEWILGISVDEDLRWSAIRIDVETGVYSTQRADRRKEKICDLPHTDSPVDLELLISDALKKIRKSELEIFKNARAVGVSSIGIIDQARGRLTNIDRKNWKRQKDGCLVNFPRILRPLFGNKEIQIEVQNDAIAKCLAEYHIQFDPRYKQTTVTTLFYAMFHDGVNGGIVEGYDNYSKPIVKTMHHELGHVYPPLHPADYNFNATDHSGCPIHKYCFVGVASDNRRKKQWSGSSLRELNNYRDDYYDGSPWDLFAHYIASMCWTIFLTLPPQRILIGGNIIFPELLPRIRTLFKSFNTYQERDYITYAPLNDPNFIDMAQLPPEAAGIGGALELARLKVSRDHYPRGVKSKAMPKKRAN